MAFQALSIVIREAQLTDFVTDLATIFNTNDSKLKAAIENIVNGFYLNTTTGVIGDPDSNGLIPINQINSRTMFMVLPSSPTTGAKFGFKNSASGPVVAGVNYDATANQPSSVTKPTSPAGAYVVTSGTAIQGYSIYFDSMSVASHIDALVGNFSIVQLTDANGLLDVAGVAQFKNTVAHKSGHAESIGTATVNMSMDIDNIVYCTYQLNRSTSENTIVNLVVPQSAYDGGWIYGTPYQMQALQIRLEIDPSTPNSIPLSGQVFNFILGSILDYTGAPITLHPPVAMYIVSAATAGLGIYDLQFKNAGNGGSQNTPATAIQFIPSTSGVSMNSLETYGSDVSFIYNYEASQPTGSIYSGTIKNVLYVKNKFAKE